MVIGAHSELTLKFDDSSRGGNCRLPLIEPDRMNRHERWPNCAISVKEEENSADFKSTILFLTKKITIIKITYKKTHRTGEEIRFDARLLSLSTQFF